MREFADRQFIMNQAAHPLFFNNKSCSLSAVPAYSSGITYEDSLLLNDWKYLKNTRVSFEIQILFYHHH
jgi:hypothetical protein